MKLGRNEQCWCGSGKKYKKCHLNREKQTPVPFHEVAKQFRSEFSYQICSCPEQLHPECSSKIIKAHTVPKSSSLKTISRNGHVYGLNMSLESINRQKGKLRPELIGINKASTFTGFCKIHDNSLFAPLEKQEFVGNKEQCFLLTYRSFSREYYTKAALANLSETRKNLDRGKPLDHQYEIQSDGLALDIGALTGVMDNEYHKQFFDEVLISQDFDKSHALVFKLDDAPPVMASGAVNPDFDFEGKQIQDLLMLDVRPDLISLNSFYDGKHGYIVFSWLEHCSESASKLLSSLQGKPQEIRLTLIVQYMFSNFENVFISPDWWEELSTEQQDIIVNIMHDNVSLQAEPSGDNYKLPKLKIPFPRVVDVLKI